MINNMLPTEYRVGQHLAGTRSDGTIVRVSRDETGRVRSISVQWDSEPYPETIWFDNHGWSYGS
jgi:hypothetical protein